MARDPKMTLKAATKTTRCFSPGIECILLSQKFHFGVPSADDYTPNPQELPPARASQTSANTPLHSAPQESMSEAMLRQLFSEPSSFFAAQARHPALAVVVTE
jgi:hypothetical protein